MSAPAKAELAHPGRVKAFLAVLTAALAVAGGIPLYKHRHSQMPIVAGPGVTKVIKLSDYLPALKGRFVDTDVFVMEGAEPGGKALLLADTHANEPAGLLACQILIENAVVEKGTLYIIPTFNRSASRNTKAGDGYPLYFDIPTDWGQVRFRMGTRDTSPLESWPDPDAYIHYPDKQAFSYLDVRNINRTWPGRPDGPIMERVTFAAMEMMRREKIDVALDFHGAETMFPVTNCVVAPQKSAKIATLATMMVKAMEGFDSHVEPSPQNFRGLSHREIGDFSDTLPFLLEAPIPFLDQPTGPKTVKFLLDGKDPFLLSLAKKKKLFVPYDEKGWPMDKRVGQHMSTALEILRQFSKKTPDRAIRLTGAPKYADLIRDGVGKYYRDPAKAEAGRVHYE
ncbi:MAG: succinylglutamate desuccinylase/aspartoacylase family protein [Candidatus Aminicenantes bacterium]|nr:succinylglutamate desuccinylase/aspartoacylase family protein [Candidatus Aminicenantes bacterium]